MGLGARRDSRTSGMGLGARRDSRTSGFALAGAARLDGPVACAPGSDWALAGASRSDGGGRKNSAGGPSATTRPPAAPARGPKSSSRSALRITSRSCSTSSSVLPRLRSFVRAAISRAVSRGCSPIVGSSSTYSTPDSPLPIWLARRMRWASPPESVGAARCNVRYCRPTSIRNCSRSRISLRSSPAIFRSRSSSSRSRKNSAHWSSGISQTSTMVRPRSAAPSLPARRRHSTLSLSLLGRGQGEGRAFGGAASIPSWPGAGA